MIPCIAALLFAVCAACAAYCACAALHVKSGWQNGRGILSRYLDSRRRAKFNSQLPEALATMSNALRAGFSVAQAFDSVVEQAENPMSEEFAILQRQLRVGMGFEEALESMSGRVGSEDLSLVTTALIISRKTGGNVTEIFDRISDTIRSRMRIERKVKSLTAQGRMQGLIVSAMPLFLGLAMAVLKPGIMLPFLASAAGLASVAATVALVAAGWLMIRRIIRIDV